MGNLYKTYPQDFFYLETGVEPPNTAYQHNNDITWDRYARLSDEDKQKQLLLKNAPVRLKTRKGCRHLTSESMGNWDVPRDVTTPPLLPWKEAKNLILDMVEIEKPKQEYSEEELLRLSMNKINSITSNIVIYMAQQMDHKRMAMEVYTLRMSKETLFSKLVFMLTSTAPPTLENG